MRFVLLVAFAALTPFGLRAQSAASKQQEIHAHLQRAQEALRSRDFRAALAENPANANAQHRLGTVCTLRRDYKAAIEHYSRALQLQPDNAYAHQALGAAWIKMGEPEKALEHLLAATRLDPLYPTAHYQLGTVYRQMGREADSRRELAAFEKLEKLRKQIDQVYLRARAGFPESDLTGPSAPEN
jgi:tetratricopeptide (TPR) repeat protein